MRVVTPASAAYHDEKKENRPSHGCANRRKQDENRE